MDIRADAPCDSACLVCGTLCICAVSRSTGQPHDVGIPANARRAFACCIRNACYGNLWAASYNIRRARHFIEHAHECIGRNDRVSSRHPVDGIDPPYQAQGFGRPAAITTFKRGDAMTSLTHITDSLAPCAAKAPSKPAFICQDLTLTWQELQHEAEQFAALVAARIPSTEQEVVGILLPNSWQFVVAYLGILRAGH